MACKGARKNQATTVAAKTIVETKPVEAIKEIKKESLLFGVDSRIQSDDVLQNNITEFQWVVQ